MKKSKYKYKLYGAILGDLCGQPYEKSNIAPKLKDINIYNPKSHFTDDTVMTLASAYSLYSRRDIASCYKHFAKKYPDCGFGSRFKDWVFDVDSEESFGDSYGNGCLMRASPFMWTPNTLNKLMESVLCSHNHHESIDAIIKLYKLYEDPWGHLGDQHTPQNKRFKKLDASCGSTIKYIEDLYGYANCTTDYIKLAVKAGGDTDTNASIMGELRNYHQNDLTKFDVEYVESKLDSYLLGILKEFNEKY